LESVSGSAFHGLDPDTDSDPDPDGSRFKLFSEQFFMRLWRTQAHENGFSFWERLLPPDLAYVPGFPDARELIASAFEPQNVE
jgi:hypothetical protein